jgi:hypothetical protein
MENGIKDDPAGAIDSAPEAPGRESALVSSSGSPSATIDKVLNVPGNPSQELSEPHREEWQEKQELMTENESGILSKSDEAVESYVKEDGDRDSYVPETISVTAELPVKHVDDDILSSNRERGAAGDEVEDEREYIDIDDMSVGLNVSLPKKGWVVLTPIG